MRISNKKYKEFIWNMLGSIANSVTTVIFIAVATRTVGAYQSGILSIAIATAQMLITIGNYGVRPYQATDLNQHFKFFEYYSHRVITCFMMMVSACIFCFYSSYDKEKVVLILLACILKMLDAFADVFEGYMHQMERLDIAGKALFFRTMGYSLIFMLTLLVTHNMVYSLVMAILAAIILLFIFIFYPVKKRETIKFNIEKKQFVKITTECFPLFLALFLMMYLINAPKYAIDRKLTADYQTYYNILYMPAQVINLLSAFVFKPLLSDLANFWNTGQIKNLKKYIFKFLLFILLFTVLCIGGASLLGIPVLQILYGLNLSGFGKTLIFILIGGGFNAIVYMLYYALTSMRKQKVILICYLMASVIALFLPSILVGYFGINGAAVSYILLMGILAFAMLIVVFYFIKKIEKESN